MNTLTNVVVNNVCHACLSYDQIIYFEENTTEHNYLTQILEVISVPIRKIINTTLVLCESCLIRLNEIKKFQNKCLETYAILFKSILDENKCVPETSGSSGIHCRSLENYINNEKFVIEKNIDREENNISNLKSNEVEKKYKAAPNLNCKLPVKESLTERYSCNSCGKSYTSSSSLKTHMYRHSGIKPFRCSLCEKAFTKKSTLNAHLTIHTGIREFLCSDCGKGFTSVTLSNRHKLVHSGERPFKCDLCPRRFIQGTDLKIHMRTHTGDKPFLCATCGKSFRRDTQLSIHMRTHTGEKPYCCETCGRSFAQSGDLRAHVRIHTGEKPYKCIVCEKKFAQNSSLSTHMKKHSGLF